ncbi:hypothetical protein [Lysobacter sp. A3-1-A15]|uniref:hypothetical protein n=1 Tax=Novilysobacter viscosus TaxID=3098602 RepID=UPI002EDA2E13
MGWRWFGLCIALAVPMVATAQDATPADAGCDAAYEALPHGTLLDLLDPDAPAERRAQALGAYERLAGMEGCPEFGYTLGQLYRHGPYLPGNLLPQDLPKARRLIRAMAEDGYLPAYADLAEMEMRHANAREAMKWTQAYLYFTREVRQAFIDDADDLQYQRSAYNGNLLARVEIISKWARPPLPSKVKREDLKDYLAVHGAPVAKRMLERERGTHARASAQDAALIGLANVPEPCYVKLEKVGAASAAWIVEVLPSGGMGRVVLENFVPNPEVTEELKACLLERRFETFEGDRSKTMRFHMVAGSTEGASLRRRRR